MKTLAPPPRLLPALAVMLFLLPLLAPLAYGQEVKGSAYLEQLRGPREESWLRRELRGFRGYAHLDRATTLMKAGQLPQARKELEQYLATDPKDAEARYQYLLILFRMKDYGQTIRQADLILQEHSQFVPAFLYRGLAHQALGRLEQAQGDFQAAAGQSQITPEDRSFALNMVVDLAIRQKNYALALSQLEVLAKSEANYSLSFRRGLALEGLDRLADAAQAYRQALDQARTAPEQVRAHCALGELARKRQDWAAASQAFQAALNLEPDNREVLQALANLAYAQKDYPASAAYIKRALALQPTPQDREFFVNVLGFLQDYQEVTTELTRLLDQAQTPEERYRIYTALGHAYTRWGKHGEAARAFQDAAKLQDDPGVLEPLAQARERAGQLNQAIALYREILKRRPTPLIHLKLGFLLERTGNLQEAVYHLEQTAARGLPDPQRATADKQLGFIYYRLGRYAEAREALERARARQPRDPAIYQTLAETSLKLKDPKQALVYQQKALELTRAPETAGTMWENLGFMALKVDRYQEAADSFHRALAAGQDGWKIRQNLGITLFKLERWPQALEQFQAALKFRRAAPTLVYLGLTYQKLDKTGLAIPYLEEALASPGPLTPEERRDALSTLGYVYADEEEYAQAARAWSQSLALKPDPAVALALARIQRLLGQYRESLATLEGIDPGKLPPALQARRLDEMGADYQAEKQPAKALEALSQANEMESTPARDYRIGRLYQEEGKSSEALPYLQRAATQDPQTNQYQVALGYAHLKEKNYLQAARLFEEVLRRDPDYLKLYEDLGYAYLHGCENDQAVSWFKRAIDNQALYPVSSPEETEQLRRDMYRFRKEVSKLTNRYDFTFYLAYQTAKPSQSVAPGGVFGGGAVPSQGGVEFAYTPPKIGFRDERIFQVFTRVLWNIKPGSMRFDEDSFQGGVGLRYKPLKTQNFYFWGERLFKMGKNALDDWLLRLLYSWDYGYDLKPGRRRWNYTFLYGDLAYFTKAPGTWAYYAEIRQGVTFNRNDRFLITPHLVVDARFQDPLAFNSSYLEGGVGVSLKYLFWETRYEVHRASFEVLAYYKHGNFLERQLRVSGDKYDGFFITGIFHF